MNNAFWRELLDHIPSAVLLFRIDEQENAHLMFANDAVKDLTGYTPADLVLESEQNAAMQTALTALVDAIAAHSHNRDTAPGLWHFPARSGEQLPLSFTYRIFTSRAVSQPFICALLAPATGTRDNAPAPNEAAAPADSFVAVSASIKAIIERFTWFAGQPVNLVFTGESGQGKRTLAGRFLRYNQERNGAAFSIFDAAAGGDFYAFLNGTAPVKALWNLDQLSADAQRRLIEAGNGIRIVATAGSALEPLIDRGVLLPELVYSLNFVSVTVPPLHRRKDDAVAYINRLAQVWSPVFESAAEAAESMRLQIAELDWDGTFASLRAGYRRLCVDMEPNSDYDDPQFELFGEAGLPGPLTFNEYNRAFLKTVLKFTKGKIYGDDGAAKLLGLKPTTLQSKLKKLGIR